jgi:hypothetical protein
MPSQAAQLSHQAIHSGSVAGSSFQQSRASSRSAVIGVAGALATAAAIAGFVMMAGSAPAPVGAQVASVASEPASTVAPAYIPAPAPAQTIAPATNFAPPNFAPALAPIAPPQTQQPSASDQCRLGQPDQLALQISASSAEENGNRVRFIVGSYVSPVFTITRSPQTVTFPVPAGSRGAAQMVVEQQIAKGSTWDGIDGLDIEFGPTSRDHLRSVVNLHWTPHC